jgi:hypothetical protein
MSHLTARMPVSCRLASPGGCGRWLPVWLPDLPDSACVRISEDESAEPRACRGIRVGITGIAEALIYSGLTRPHPPSASGGLSASPHHHVRRPGCAGCSAQLRRGRATHVQLCRLQGEYAKSACQAAHCRLSSRTPRSPTDVKPPARRAYRRSVSALNPASSNAAAVRGRRLSRGHPVARGVLGRLDYREMPLTTGVHIVTTSLPVVCRRTKSTHA